MQNGSLRDWNEHRASRAAGLRHSSDSARSFKAGRLSTSGRQSVAAAGAQPALIRSSTAFKEFVASHGQRDTVRTATPPVASREISRSHSADLVGAGAPAAANGAVSTGGSREPTFAGGHDGYRGTAERSRAAAAPAGASTTAAVPQAVERITRGRSRTPVGASQSRSPGTDEGSAAPPTPGSARPADILARFDKLLTQTATLQQAQSRNGSGGGGPEVHEERFAAMNAQQAQNAAMMEQMHNMLTALATQVTTTLEALDKRIAALERKSAQPAPRQSPRGPNTLITNPYFTHDEHLASPVHTDNEATGGDSDGPTAAALRGSARRSLSAAAQYRSRSRGRRGDDAQRGSSPLAAEPSWASSSRAGIPRQASIDVDAGVGDTGDLQRGRSGIGRHGGRRSASLQPAPRSGWAAAPVDTSASELRDSATHVPLQTDANIPAEAGGPSSSARLTTSTVKPASDAHAHSINQRPSPSENMSAAPAGGGAQVDSDRSREVESSPYEVVPEGSQTYDSAVLQSPQQAEPNDSIMATSGSPAPSALKQTLPTLSQPPAASAAAELAAPERSVSPQVPMPGTNNAPAAAFASVAGNDDDSAAVATGDNAPSAQSLPKSQHSHSSGSSRRRRTTDKVVDQELDGNIAALVAAKDELKLLRFVQRTPPAWQSLSADSSQRLLQVMCKCAHLATVTLFQQSALLVAVQLVAVMRPWHGVGHAQNHVHQHVHRIIWSAWRVCNFHGLQVAQAWQQSGRNAPMAPTTH